MHYRDDIHNYKVFFLPAVEINFFVMVIWFNFFFYKIGTLSRVLLREHHYLHVITA